MDLNHSITDPTLRNQRLILQDVPAGSGVLRVAQVNVFLSEGTCLRVMLTSLCFFCVDLFSLIDALLRMLWSELRIGYLIRCLNMREGKG